MATPSKNVMPRKARLGTAHGFSMDPLSLTRLQHLQAFTAEHFDVQHSQSALVRRAIAFYGKHLDAITTGLRSASAKAKDALDAEKYFVKVASTGAVVPFGALPEGSAVLTWKELIDRYTDKRSVVDKLMEQGA